MDAAILNIQWLAKDWGEDLGEVFPGEEGGSGWGGGGGGGLIQGFCGGDTGGQHPLQPKHGARQGNKFNSFRGPHDAIIKPRCE